MNDEKQNIEYSIDKYHIYLVSASNRKKEQFEFLMPGFPHHKFLRKRCRKNLQPL